MAIFEGAGKLVPSLSNVADNWCLTTSIALYGQLYAMRFLKNDEYKHFLKIWGGYVKEGLERHPRYVGPLLMSIVLYLKLTAHRH